MGDLRAGPAGTSTPQATGKPANGKRVARHSAEVVTEQPYVGRRVAAAPGRRRAEPAVEPTAPANESSEAPVVGRRARRIEVVPVAVSLDEAVTSPTADGPFTPVATLEPVVVEPVIAVAPAPEPATLEPVVDPVVDTGTLALEPVSLPAITHEPRARREAPRRTSPGGRRAARRRSPLPLPGAPLLIGVAVLAVSAGGALHGMRPDAHPATAGHRLTPASALSGTDSIGTTNLLGDRAPVVSRDSDRLQATADAQAKQRAEVLSGIASKAQQQSHKIQQHAWVLPVTPGVYHLTARFGDYSSLWSNFHTGLDFAAPTGTPIMAVASGVITETAYSGAYGNRTIERLPDGTELWYCHQNEFGTQVGATVRPGEVIGYVGSTGNVTGPHLHLEVHPGGGDPVDPYTALVAHGLYPGPPS